MYLFIDTISKQNKIILFDKNNIIQSEIYDTNSNESDKLFRILKKFDIKNIQYIGCINGPGNFSSIRIGVLFCNTLAYFLDKYTYSIDYMTFIKRLFFQNYPNTNKIQYDLDLGPTIKYKKGVFYNDEKKYNYDKEKSYIIDISQNTLLTEKDEKYKNHILIDKLKIKNLYSIIKDDLQSNTSILPLYIKLPNITKRKKL